LQLFLNLTNNSIDAMPKGGGLEITTRFDRAARSAELLFRDSGVGIEPSAIEHLFEPMWTTKEAGSGFGLAIAYEIAIEHGGKIEIVAEQHVGAAFRLTLPLNVAASPALEVVTNVA
jgi:signal transduction histidine kinase